MPFKGNRIYGIVILIAFVFLIAALVASSPPPKKTPEVPPADNTVATPIPLPATITVTIKSEIGIRQITITNLNTGTSIIKQQTDLPFSFNAARGDGIRFSILTDNGYMWNAWELSLPPWFDNHNPLTMKVSSDMVMYPKCIIQEVPLE